MELFLQNRFTFQKYSFWSSKNFMQIIFENFLVCYVKGYVVQKNWSNDVPNSTTLEDD